MWASFFRPTPTCQACTHNQPHAATSLPAHLELMDAPQQCFGRIAVRLHTLQRSTVLLLPCGNQIKTSSHLPAALLRRGRAWATHRPHTLQSTALVCPAAVRTQPSCAQQQCAPSP